MMLSFPTLRDMLLLERCQFRFEQLQVGEGGGTIGIDEEDAVTGRVEDALYTEGSISEIQGLTQTPPRESREISCLKANVHVLSLLLFLDSSPT
jgi:hypothetical protein